MHVGFPPFNWLTFLVTMLTLNTHDSDSVIEKLQFSKDYWKIYYINKLSNVNQESHDMIFELGIPIIKK